MYTMTIDGAKLYDPTLTEYALEVPHMELEANRFATLTFTIYPGNPRYGQIQNMKSLIRLYRDGEIRMIFRPVTSRVTMRGGIEYTCEELTALLNDILRRPKSFEGTARQLIQECLSDATTLSGDGAIFRPSVEYFRSILVNGAFPHLTGSSQIGARNYQIVAGRTNDNQWESLYPVYRYTGDEVDDLNKALAALGYFGDTYVPKTTWYDSVAVRKFMTAHGVNEWANNEDCVQAGIWASLEKEGVFAALLSEMQQFIADLPPTDDDWDAQVTGFPVIFNVGATPASDTLDNNVPDSADRTVLTFGENDYVGYWDYLQENLVEPYGGYLVPIWSENSCGICYMRDSDLPLSGQTIRFGDNLADLFIDDDCAEAYSTIIPLGKDGVTIASVAPHGKDTLIDSEAYELYGRREIIKQWDEIETAQKLYEKAMNWMLSKSLKLKDLITASAYDLRYTGVNVDYLTFMENIHIISEKHGIDEILPIRAASVSLDSPAANTFEIGNQPENVLDEEDNRRSRLTDSITKTESYVERMVRRGVFRRMGGTIKTEEDGSGS